MLVRGLQAQASAAKRREALDKVGGLMSKMLFAALLAADLVAARPPQLIPTAAAQTPARAKN